LENRMDQAMWHSCAAAFPRNLVRKADILWGFLSY
jgi:hypothetical protein